ncbi:hypothetical protein GLYMA_12G090600v4 [Glycine max]|uniref:Uncharacterized protein ycf68 n=1 Tax=Glycine max TaxID=3847 RepID=A0A0R0H3S8_SOYBN|nr:hypothetical protein GYH30_033154 [Glycine max]KRH25258.1 hypothetical protein GLYMA_12G090600v4 [Glycine max]
MAYFSCLNRGLKPNLSSGRIDGTIQVRSNVDPTFFSLVGSRRSGGTTTTPLFFRIHTCLISLGLVSMKKNEIPNNVSSHIKKYEIIPFILGSMMVIHQESQPVDWKTSAD